MEGKNKVEQLISNIKEYAETRFDIAALNIQDKIADVLSSLTSVIVVALLGVFIIFFSSVGIAWWIGRMFHNPSIGFFCIAGFYLLIAIVIILNRNKWIKFPVINALLKKININEEG